PQLSFSFYRHQPIRADFSGGQITSDAGLLPLRAFDQRHHLTSGLAARLGDPRQEDRVRHDSLALLRQRIYQIVAGYEDANDADRLRHDPMFKIVADQELEHAHAGQRPELCLAFSKFGLLSDNNPSPTSGTRDARARNAISHFKIIGRFASWTSSFWRCSKEAYAMATLPRPSEPAQSPFAQTPGAASQHSTSGEDPRHFPVHAEELDSAQENRPRQSRWTRDVSS